MTTEFRKGDKVRVTVEGVITWVGDFTHDVRVDENFVICVPEKHRGALELVERAAPEWWPLQQGDVLVSNMGHDLHFINERVMRYDGLDYGLAKDFDWKRYGAELRFRDGKPYPQDGAR